MRVRAKIEKNEIKVELEYLGKWRKYLKDNNGKEVLISITTNEIRTIEQNKYYWGGVINAISDYTGYEKDELHSYFKYQYIYRKIVKTAPSLTINRYLDYLQENETVASIDKYISTTILNTKQFAEYIDLIRDFASKELNLYIPTPEEANV